MPGKYLFRDKAFESFEEIRNEWFRSGRKQLPLTHDLFSLPPSLALALLMVFGGPALFLFAGAVSHSGEIASLLSRAVVFSVEAVPSSAEHFAVSLYESNAVMKEGTLGSLGALAASLHQAPLFSTFVLGTQQFFISIFSFFSYP